MRPIPPLTLAVALRRCGWIGRGRADHGSHGPPRRYVVCAGVALGWCGGRPQGGRLARKWGVVHAPHLTLMRTPVVKRQTLPQSGLCHVFPLGFRPSAVRLWQRVLSLFPYTGAPTWLHRTRIEARSLAHWCVQRADDTVLCGLENIRALVPSYAKAWLHGRHAPVSPRFEGDREKRQS
jgi:hypothetical protein